MSLGHRTTRSYRALQKGLLAADLFVNPGIGRTVQEQGTWICGSCRHNSTRALRTLHQLKRSGPALSIKYSSTDSKAVDKQSSPDASAASSSSIHTEELPSVEELRRSRTSKRFSSVMDNLQANIFFAGQRLNDLTGYSGIEALKREIEACRADLRDAQSSLAAAKTGYSSAITQRLESQREVNELLQRKSSWNASDLERFTSLVRSDHANELAESDARQHLDMAEKRSDESSVRLNAKIDSRYHEEQIWSDKIRRMSTWGTWGLMGLNVLLFIVFQILMEPWRRKRLVKGFEEKVQEALDNASQRHSVETGEALNKLNANMVAAGGTATAPASIDADANADATTDAVVGLSAEPVAATAMKEVTDQVVTDELAEERVASEVILKPGLRGWSSWIPGLSMYRRKLEDSLSEQFSDRQVTVRQVDLTQKALEGLFAGVMITSILATLVRGR